MYKSNSWAIYDVFVMLWGMYCVIRSVENEDYIWTLGIILMIIILFLVLLEDITGGLNTFEKYPSS